MIPKFRFYDKKYKIWLNPECVWLDEKGNFRGIDGVNRFESFDDKDIILMQYTGLNDKNGVEIFESDIVRSCVLINGHLYEYVGQVKFVAFSWNVVDKKQTYYPFYNYIDGYPDEIWEIEVIGNIYQNPELLESVEE